MGLEAQNPCVSLGFSLLLSKDRDQRPLKPLIPDKDQGPLKLKIPVFLVHGFSLLLSRDKDQGVFKAPKPFVGRDRDQGL